MAQLNHPDDLRYAKTHEWVRLSGDEATIGISDYAQDELGDVVSLELPWGDAGQREMQAQRHFGDIDSVKATSELFAPVSGQLISLKVILEIGRRKAVPIHHAANLPPRARLCLSLPQNSSCCACSGFCPANRTISNQLSTRPL